MKVLISDEFKTGTGHYRTLHIPGYGYAVQTVDENGNKVPIELPDELVEHNNEYRQTLGTLVSKGTLIEIKEKQTKKEKAEPVQVEQTKQKE